MCGVFRFLGHKESVPDNVKAAPYYEGRLCVLGVAHLSLEGCTRRYTPTLSPSHVGAYLCVRPLDVKADPIEPLSNFLSAPCSVVC